MRRGICMLAAWSATAAAAPPAEVTADQAVALYRAHSPRLAAALADVDVAAADIVDARVYPNPTVGVSNARTVGGTDTIGTSQYALSVDVPILIGHQRGHREAAARAHVDATRFGVASEAATAELAIRSAFATLQLAQERRATIAAAVDDVRNVRVIVAGRSSAGATSPYALDRIDLAIAQIASTLDEAHADEVAAQADLAGAVGLPGWRPHAIGVLQPGTPPPAGVEPDHPKLVEAHQAEVATRADESKARADGTPTPSLGLQSFVTTQPSGIALVAGVSIPLPMFDRNQGAVARARAQTHRAQLELAARANELDADLARARDMLDARKDALARFQNTALHRLAELREKAETAYRSGQGGIVELLDALDAIRDARLRELELRSSVVEAELAIRAAATGR